MLKIEWLKLKGYRPFWVVMAAYPTVLFALMLLFARFYTKLGGSHREIQNLIESPFAFPKVWYTTTYLASWFHFIPCVLIMLNVCNEFQYRTHRQNLMDGWSRAQFFGAKLLVAAGITLVCYGWVTVLSLGFGAFTGGRFSLEGSHRLGYFLLQAAVYNSLALLLSFLLRRGLLSLAVFLGYPIAESIAFGLLSLFGGEVLRPVSFFGPLNMANKLVAFPYFQKQMAEAVSKLAPGEPAFSVFVTMSFVYTALFLTISWLSFRRDDL